MALSPNFAVAITVDSNSNENNIGATTKKILTKDVALDEAHATFLAVQIAASFGVYSLIFERYALNVVLAIQQPHCLRVGVFLMLFLTFFSICFFSIIGKLKKFLGVLTIKSILFG